MPSSIVNDTRAACDENHKECVVCPPEAPDENACIASIDLNVAKIIDDIRVEVNGVPIIDSRCAGIGSYSRLIIGSKHGLKELDVITLKVFAKGMSFCVGAWFADVKYARNGSEFVLTFRDVNDTAPQPVTPGQEYYQFAQFTL